LIQGFSPLLVDSFAFSMVSKFLPRRLTGPARQFSFALIEDLKRSEDASTYERPAS
jgi:hypothetical protein